MCSLKIILNLIIIFLVLEKVSASPNEVIFSYSSSETLQLNEINVPQSNQILMINSPFINEKWLFVLTFNQIKQDLSNRNITLKNSDQIPLDRLDNGERQTFATQIDYNWESQTTSLSINQDIKKSLFTSKSFGLTQTFPLYSGATKITAHGLFTEQNQPLSYYIDPESLDSKERPTQVNTITLIAGIEQIWTEKFKTLTELKFQKAEQLRPAYYTLSVSQALALSNQWTLKSQVSAARENQQEGLYDDRGYFESNWLDLDFIYEWKLDSFISLGISALDEKEFDPRRNRTTLLGTDELALAVKQKFNEISYDIGFSYYLNSEKQTATGYKGSLAWNF